MKKYKYNINNLDCANCARELEESLNKNKDFKNVVVNFNTSKLSYESNKEFTIKELNNFIKEIEPDSYLSQEEVPIKKEYHLSILILGIVICLLGYFLKINDNVKLALYIISYVLLLYRTFLNSIKLLIKSKTINENLLITISCLGAFFTNNVLEGAMVISLYTIGKILEEKAINNSRRSIKDLLDIKQSYANLKKGNTTSKIDVEDIKINDLLIIKKGEKIPVDGVIVKGSTYLDMSSLTGESAFVPVSEKSNVLSGSINVSDVITIKATSLFEDSTVNKIIELLENATDKKTKTETIISKFSKIYTPIILLLAILVIIFLPLLFNVSQNDALYRGLTFLVISCPCAIAISIPLSYFTGIGVASKKGILIKGSNYLDNLSNTTSIIFDKTGTLTSGNFKVTDIVITDKSYTKDEIIDIMVKGESFSNHPIAKSITNLKKDKIIAKDVKDFKELEGKGISFKINDDFIIIGNKTLCNCHEDGLLHLNVNNKHVASIYISDGIKDNASKTIEKLKKYKIKIFMFTGDKKEVALDIGSKLKIDEIKYEMLPKDKYESYEEVAKDNKITMFIGDGVNDAPVLKRADIGISMGNVGSEVAIEASDIVIMNDEIDKIPLAIDISKYTKYIIKQNLIFAITVKLLILFLSLFGYANMWLAVFADTGVTLLTILNTLRIIKKYK